MHRFLRRAIAIRANPRKLHRTNLARQDFFTARVLRLGTLLAFALACSCVHAQDGAYAPGFAQQGRELQNIGIGQSQARSMIVRPDGRIVLAGDCEYHIFNVDWPTLCLMGLRPDGSLDHAFGPAENGRIVLGDYVESASFPENAFSSSSLLRLPDGRLVLVGNRSRPDPTIGLVVRLSDNGVPETAADGHIHHEFAFAHHATAPDNVVAAAAMQGDKLIVVGSAAREGSNPPNEDFGIARLNPDLSLDTSFNGTGTRLAAFDLGGANKDFPTAVAVQRDGKIVLAGTAQVDAQTYALAVLRLNADGSADASFGDNGRVWYSNPGMGTVALALILDRQGRILVAGGVQPFPFRDQSDVLVMRLLPGNGQPDPSFGDGGFRVVAFNFGIGNDDAAKALALQPDGRILLAGVASDATTGSVFAIVRLTANGQLDSSYGIGGRGWGSFAAPTQQAAGSDAQAAVVANGGLMLAGIGKAAGGGDQFGIAKLQLDLIFSDGFQP